VNPFKSTLMGAAAAALALMTTTALAGSGVGDVFNLGVANTVDATSTLSGDPGANPELRVSNTGATGAGIRADAQAGIAVTGNSISGTGQLGQSQSGIGLSGIHTATTGANPGVQGTTNSTAATGAGVLGKNTGGGPGLSAVVKAGAPPLAVNSPVKVANLNADLLDGLDSARLWKVGGNGGTTPGADFLGTTDNTAVELKVNGQRALRIEPNGDSPNLVGGSAANSIGPGVSGATIGGGGGAPGTENKVTGGLGTIGGGWQNTAGGSAAVAGGQGNTASGNYAAAAGGFFNAASGQTSAVAGGDHNTASGPWASVGGGSSNTASGNGNAVGGGYNNQASNLYSTIGGGFQNDAAGQDSTVAGGAENSAGNTYSAVGGGFGNHASGAYAFVGGGHDNTAGALDATVAGGRGNWATGNYSTVPGGLFSAASGFSSLAAGTWAKATQTGSFVWGDFQQVDLTSPAANTFTVRASGGIWLGTNSSPSIGANRFIDTSTGAYLSSAGAWTNNSDRARKHDLRSLNTKRLLQKVARLPITSWSYKAEQPSVRHIGPMAQDFYRAFGLGLDDKHITTIDEGGVALAAIQGLYRENQALERKNAAVSARLARLERAVAALGQERGRSQTVGKSRLSPGTRPS
jgi:trimeric autotransporter adhesin